MARAVPTRLFAKARERARERWPDLGVVSDAELDAYIAARVPAETDEDHVRAEDLLLACACTKGARSAHDAIDELFGPDIDRAHARLRPPLTVAQTRHLVLQRLLGMTDGSAARIALYRGDSELGSWVRNFTNRLLLGMTGQAKQPEVLEDALLLRKTASPTLALDPELQRVKQNFLPGLRLAVTHTLGSLEPRERALLRYAVVDQLDAASIGLLYGLPLEAVKTGLTIVREKLEYRLKNGLAQRMRVSDRDHASLVRFFGVQLDTALATTLG